MATSDADAFYFSKKMIRTITILLNSVLFAVSCNKQDTLPKQESDVSTDEPIAMVDRKIHVEVQNGLVVITDRQSRLVSDVKNLFEGMSIQQVKDRLGKPSEESPKLLFYNCLEGAEGGHYVNARLTFSDEGLASAEIGFGHVTLERMTSE